MTAAKQIMLALYITEIKSLNILLIFGGVFLLSSFSVIQLYWCKVITTIETSEQIKKFSKIMYWVIIGIGASTTFFLIVGFLLWWDRAATNAILIVYSILCSLTYSLIVWRLYIYWTHMDINNPTIGKEIHRKIIQIILLAIVIIGAGMVFGLTLIGLTIWTPSSDNENVAWLFISRSAECLYVFGILFFKPMSFKKNSRQQVTDVEMTKKPPTPPMQHSPKLLSGASSPPSPSTPRALDIQPTGRVLEREV
ncbi:hypothetical protein SAMD00019534_067130, partial [Acytostelium subglobosum LB1]|uniref:hypothetical protein n=1 Tax=Acytostelium subglobosum LB1 TaxID=1410327 RepID=UPI0006450BB1